MAEISDNILNKIDRLEGESLDSLDDLQKGSVLDQDYKNSYLKHRNFIQSLNQNLEIVSHPFSLLIVVFGIIIVLAITRYIGIALKIEWLQIMSSDLEKVLSYMGTIIITHIITKFLEQRKNR